MIKRQIDGIRIQFTNAKIIICFVLFFCLATIQAKRRHYYLALVEEDWDFAPTGHDQVTITNGSDAWIYLKPGPNRIGHVYKKAIYRQFTDSTYTVEIPKPGWLGMLGPVLHGELGDILYVHFWNKGSRHYSVHPHGIRYFKPHEGALYLDGTMGPFKRDDMVPAGHHHLYIWNITYNFAPAKDDPGCISWAYHSHVFTTRDANSGAIGCLVTCKAGILNEDGSRRDVDREFVLLAKVFDENKSWYIRNNFKKCGNPMACIRENLIHDPDQIQSNMVFSINGYSYGNGPAFPACTNERVAWHVMSMGSNSDLHSIHFDGQVIDINGHTMDTLRVASAMFLSGIMTTSIYPGRWLISCEIAHHYMSGMLAYMDLNHCGSDLLASHHIQESYHPDRVYYLSVEEVIWDYAPSDLNLFTGGRLDKNGSDSAQVYATRPNRIAHRYKKALYFGYTDASYTQKIVRGKDELHLGFLGPVIQAEEGETVQVHLRNMASRPYSFVPHGTQYSKSNEGSLYRSNLGNEYNPDDNQGNGARIAYPGKTEVYTFQVPKLGERDTECKTFPYQSSVNFIKDINSGLIGPLLFCKKGILQDGKPLHINRNFFLVFFVVDENLSWYLKDNIALFVKDKRNLDIMEEDFIRSNLLHVINGYGYANLVGLDMCVGDRVMWHLFCVGSEFDVHTVYFHGHTFHRHAENTDAQELSAQLSETVVMDINNPGKWAIVCRTIVHYQTGMQVLYNVKQCGAHDPWFNLKPSPRLAGRVRRYYIAAEEILWQYAPLKRSLITGEKITAKHPEEYIYIRNGKDFIGDVYKKAVFREYTDSTFSKAVGRDSYSIHLGILGPFIKAEVGDTIKILFMNKASRPYSMHPQGVHYDKQNEGQVYLDGHPNKKSGRVPPGETFEYTWTVPKSSGPGPSEANCIPSMYYSSQEPIRDPYTGLMGPLIICRKGILDERDSRKDVDKEFALFFSIMDENMSWYLSENIAKFAPARLNTSFANDPTFYQSNYFFTINGLIYGNNKGFVMTVGDRVAWYVMALGSDKDIHTAHFHGQTFLQHTDGVHRGDVLEVSASVARTIEIQTDNPGTWILHCHVNEHIIGGMEMTYTILPKEF